VLLWVLFSFVVMSALASAALRSASTSRRSAKVSKEWDRGMYVAEAGLNRVLPICADTLVDHLNPGDSLDLGWTTIGETGDRYRPIIHRIDNDEGDKMYLVSVEGRVSSRFGGTPSVSVVTTMAANTPPGAVAVNGDLRISGSTVAAGECAGVSATGSIEMDSTLTTDGEVVAGGSVKMDGGLILDSTGGTVTPQSDADPIVVPSLSVAGYCAQADYIMRNGWVVRTATSDSAMAGTGAASEWKWTMDKNVYRVPGDLTVPGTVCAQGNVELTGDIATPFTPLSLTILATGSVAVDGNVSIVADHPGKMLILAEGDVKMNPTGANRLDGLIYAGSQCGFDGPVVINGRIQCADAPDPAAALNLYDTNRLNGQMVISPACGTSGTGGATRLRPLENRAWMQRY